VAEERALAEIAFRRLADQIADVARLEWVIWEHEPVYGHTGYQQQIERPSQCDLVVGILWSRLGTRLPASFSPTPGAEPPTGTEFELDDALESHARTGKPHMLIYRKTPGPAIGLGSADFAQRTEQYRRLDDFCQRRFFDAAGAVIVAHTTFTDSHDFERRLNDHLRGWLDQQVLSVHSKGFQPLWRGKSPFRGLQPFEAEHQAVFFGRSQALGDLIGRIRKREEMPPEAKAPRLLLVQGMSGSGKSSLFSAGVLPLLALRPVENIAKWITVTVRPSEADPSQRELGMLAVLAARLAEAVPSIPRLAQAGRNLAVQLKERPNEAVARIETCLAAEAHAAGCEPARVRLFVYFDQLEELFAQGEANAANAETNAAQTSLPAIVAMTRSASIWTAASIRSDFVHRLDAFPDFMQCLADGPAYTLLPPRTDELAEMIREPAKAAGLVWEEKDGVSLDQELLREAAGNPEALPLLEYTLSELYERRDGRWLRWSEYRGGLRSALINAAEQVVEEGGAATAAFSTVMRELVGVGEDGTATRRYASMGAFTPGSPAAGLLQRLIERRLCVTTDAGGGRGPVAYLAHEALIRSWPRAQEWLQNEITLLRVRDEVMHEVGIWKSHGRKDDWLALAPEKLSAIRQLEQANFLPAGDAADYARRSRRRARRDRTIERSGIATICGLLVAAVVAATIAATQRNNARDEAETADRTKAFMASMFEQANPESNPNSDITVQTMLTNGAKDLMSPQQSLADQPRVRAELLTVMGKAYSGLGTYGQAQELLARALADEDSPRTTPAALVGTLVAYGNSLYLDARYDESAAILRKTVDVARRRLDPLDVRRSAALTALAEVLAQQRKFAEAEALCREALGADQRRVPLNLSVLAETQATTGDVYVLAGDMAAAEAAMRKSLELREQASGKNSALTAQAINALGYFYYESGLYPKALQTYEEALPIYEKVYGPEHRETGTPVNNIGRLLLMSGEVDKAEPLLRRALAISQKTESDTSDDLVSPLNSLAMVDEYRGNLPAAYAEIEKADAIASPPDHDQFLDQVLVNKADIELALGQADKGAPEPGHMEKAAQLLSQAKAKLESEHPQSPEDAWRYAIWDSVNARLLAAQGHRAQAESTLAAALPVIAKRFGDSGFYILLAKQRGLDAAPAK
jgi:tetratricopeptide (TPR) repeat protein